MSSNPLSQDVNDGLQYFKDLGFIAMQGSTVEFVVDLSNDGNVEGTCPSAGFAPCAAVSAALMNQPETQAYITGLGLIQTAYGRLASLITGQYVLPFRMLVIHPDLSFEIYEFEVIGFGMAWNAVENTAVVGDEAGPGIIGGGPSGPGSLSGWNEYFQVGQPETISVNPGSGGGSCTVGITAVRDEEGNIVSIRRTTVC